MISVLSQLSKTEYSLNLYCYILRKKPVSTYSNYVNEYFMNHMFVWIILRLFKVIMSERRGVVLRNWQIYAKHLVGEWKYAIVITYAMFCLKSKFQCPTTRVCSLLKVRHVIRCIIMKYSRPLIWSTCEVIKLHPSSIWQKVFNSQGNRTRYCLIVSPLP